ncbi:MAG TPA: hypothetical protein VD948_02745 [Rhodothermales bacterium]|nr:hypothetical protein [Rhodothermales bacterium]
MKPDDYRSACRVKWERPERYGFAVIPVLEFLRGKPWDDLAANMLAALRPSFVRVANVRSAVTCDAIGWRVTVWIREDDKTIDRIDQEVEVGLEGELPGGRVLQHGHDLMCQLGVR